MKRIFNFAILLQLLVLGSCSESATTDGGVDLTVLKPVNFTNGTITKASGATWEKKDTIGIYMFKNGTTTAYGYNGVTYSNIQYFNALEDGSNAAFSVLDAAQTIYYPMDNSLSDFVAVYPYSSEISSDFIYPLDNLSQSDQPAIDLMSAKTNDAPTTTENLALEFRHLLSQLNIEVAAGDGNPSLDGLTVTIQGLKSAATYNIISNEISFTDGAPTPDVVAAEDLTAIVIPQEAYLVFNVVTDDAINGFHTESQLIKFKAGMTTTVSLTLNRLNVVFGTSTIVDWVEYTDEKYDFDAEQSVVSFAMSKAPGGDDLTSGTLFDSGNIGIYMFNTGKTTVVDDVANVQYSATPEGGFTVVNSGDKDNTIYYPQGDVMVDFMAYSPYNTTVMSADDYIYNITATEQIDLLQSKINSKSITTESQTFEFSHMMAKLVVSVTPGVGSPDLTGLTIAVDGLINTGTCDLSADEAAVVCDNAAATQLTIEADKDCIIIPQTATLKFTIKTDENTVGFVASNHFTFEPGTIKTINLTVNRSDVDFNAGSTVVDWETVQYNSDVNLY